MAKKNSKEKKPQRPARFSAGAQVLVRFTAMSLSGSFAGPCLYAQRDGTWDACPIRPSESRSIATAEAWLVKRKWKAWC